MLTEENLGRSLIQVPWVESPNFETEFSSSSLPEPLKQIALQYHREGYAIIEPELLSFETISSSIIDDLKARYQGEGRLTNAWEYHAGVRALATAPKVLEVLRALYRREPIPYQTLNFPVGTEQKSHSDSIHFASVPARFMCGVWVALEDTDPYNGPLHYFPGSHRLPIIGVEDLGFNAVESVGKRYQLYEEFMADFISFHNLEKKELYLRKGQALIWSANLLHGGNPILDRKRSRHSQVTHYFFSNCQYYAPIQSTIFEGKIQFISFKNIRSGERVRQVKPPFINYFRLTSRYRVKKILEALRYQSTFRPKK